MKYGSLLKKINKQKKQKKKVLITKFVYFDKLHMKINEIESDLNTIFVK